MNQPVRLGDLFRPMIREHLHERTGLHVVWESDGGSDGHVAWFFSAYVHGYVTCYSCGVHHELQPGTRSLPSPVHHCEHMMRALP